MSLLFFFLVALTSGDFPSGFNYDKYRDATTTKAANDLANLNSFQETFASYFEKAVGDGATEVPIVFPEGFYDAMIATFISQLLELFPDQVYGVTGYECFPVSCVRQKITRNSPAFPHYEIRL
jgi:hypothetical protein